MMQTKVIGTKETLKFLDKATDEALAILDREMKVSSAKTLEDASRTLTSKGKHVTGELIRSGRTIKGKGSYVVAFGGNAPAGSVVYATVVEHGRRAGKKPPPIQPIADWVRQKGLSGTYSIKSRKRTGKYKSQAEEDRQAAFFISRKIGKRGTKPTPFLTPAFLKERVKFINKLKTIFK